MYKQMNILITGGAGFIGSHLAERMLKEGHKVFCVDNFELGKPENVAHLNKMETFKLYKEDVSNIDVLDAIMKENDINLVFHLAANSDIQKSGKNPGIDFKNTFSTTYAVLECMRKNNIKRLFFASTSAVYGEKVDISLTEKTGELAPISYYGGGKLASEAFIHSYTYMNDFDVTIFRFPNVIGPHLTHGVIFDFIRKLKKNPSELQILGDGTQTKPYIYVLDLIDAIVMVTLSDEKGVQIYNAGVDTSTSVKKIADMVCKKMNLSNVTYAFTGGKIGWKGDVPTFKYDLTKIHQRGWTASHTSDESVQATLDSIDLETINS